LGISVRTIKRVDDTAINSWVQITHFTMQTEMLDYNFSVDINEEDIPQFNADMDC
jgi:hypothetical protein